MPMVPMSSCTSAMPSGLPRASRRFLQITRDGLLVSRRPSSPDAQPLEAPQLERGLTALNGLLMVLPRVSLRIRRQYGQRRIVRARLEREIRDLDREA